MLSAGADHNLPLVSTAIRIQGKNDWHRRAHRLAAAVVSIQPIRYGWLHRAFTLGEYERMNEQNLQQNQTRQDEEIFRGRLITLRTQIVRMLDGQDARYEIVDHPDAAAVVAVRYNADGSGEPLVALVHQQRPAIGKETIELPAGLVDPHERDHPEQTAARELREETGFTAGTLRLLTREYSSPGFTNEAISIYLATDIAVASDDAIPDPSEIARVQWIPLSEAMQLVREGRIDDSKTVIGLWLARDALGIVPA